MRTVYRNQERFENTYFKKFPGFYVTGDGATFISSSHLNTGCVSHRAEQIAITHLVTFSPQAAGGIKTVITGSQGG